MRRVRVGDAVNVNNLRRDDICRDAIVRMLVRLGAGFRDDRERHPLILSAVALSPKQRTGRRQTGVAIWQCAVDRQIPVHESKAASSGFDPIDIVGIEIGPAIDQCLMLGEVDPNVLRWRSVTAAEISKCHIKLKTRLGI